MVIFLMVRLAANSMPTKKGDTIEKT